MFLTLLETFEKEDTEFPKVNEYSEKDISVKKWDGGTHYYARVGDWDVEIDGKRKWNTYEYAYQMA